MGSSCGFSRGNIVVVVLLLLEGKVHHLFYVILMLQGHNMKLENILNIQYVALVCFQVAIKKTVGKKKKKCICF